MTVKRKFWAGALLASALASASVALWNGDSESGLSFAAESNSPAVNSKKVAVARDLSEAFQTVAESIRPSVVSISATKRVQSVMPRGGRGQQQTPQLPPGFPEEFRRFFDDDMLGPFGQLPERSWQIPSQPQNQFGLGSGVIVSADGYILTNNHVVRDADQLQVTLFDDREYRAKLVGADEKTDLAVLKINANNLVPARLGNSDELKVGQWVLAVGSPFGLDQTVTAGIISAKGRVTGIIGRDGYEDFLQTDAAINPGNSGGPLVNLHGEVIGLNTAIASRGTGGNMGVGFAIASNMAGHVMDSLITNGKVVRGYLGALIQPLNEGLAESFGFQGVNGVLIGSVLPNSPAEKAGLQHGDIVTRLNGSPVQTQSQLRNAVAALTPKSSAELEVFRNGSSQKITVTIGELESDAVAAQSETVSPESTGELGMSVEPLNRELADQIGHRGALVGVVVTRVEPDSAADHALIQVGDVIVSIAGQEITGIADYRAAVEKVDLKKGVRVRVMREGAARYVFLRHSD